MAANQSSPGVVFQERDLTTITTLSTANVGLLAAPFADGPVEQIVEIANERELANVFGKPNENNYEYWFTASQFLAYGGTLKTVRVASSSLKNGVFDHTGSVDTILIKNLDEYEGTHETSGSNTFTWAARTPGSLGNSIGIFVTDAGADQILALTAPSTGNEHEFVADEAVTATSGAAGKVFKYSIVLSIDTIVGSFSPGVATTINIGGSEESVTVLSYDAPNKKLEIALPGGGVTGILGDGQVITQGTNTAAINTTISRRLFVGLNNGSIEFAASDSVEDTNSTAVVATSVVDEYTEREYLPGLKWINVAGRPTTTNWASNAGGSNDELHVLVLDIDGKITGTTGAVLERFIGLSKASDAKTTIGETNYYATVIKQRSQYIYWGSHETQVFAATSTAADGNWGLTASSRYFNRLRSASGTTSYPTNAITLNSTNNATYYYRLTSGADYATGAGQYTVTNTDLVSAYELGEDPESQVVDFILTGPSGADDAAAIAKITSLVNIAEERRDCMLFVSPRRGNIVGVSSATTATDNIIDFFNQLPSSSYVAFDSGYKYIYDKYNDVYRYVPCNGDVAGLCLQTTEVAEPWFSPAGFQRGNLRNAIKLAFTPTKSQRDRLYGARVNPIVSFPGQGVVLYGDKTALGFASAFDRINVRRLFLTLERVISGAAKSQLFEQNDESQRSLFLNIVEPYLRDVQGRRGVTDFLVKCDTDNNPPEAVDRGEFYAEIFVKPTRTINYITLTFVATRTGVAFTEVAS
ncbi:tail sheath monomer protein [Synechococcus phage ACG-2014b]|uniref:Tail sheath monomer protein n=2 Tax=Synechococcus phage ACG-2014b TaxID=1493508 RepID=A0A0E3IAW6_9CAUD|nr:tail sheath [Synechococcus phage ACG-2014b]YP_009779735.1 tail sheath [Synechococcus phage ACG-2014b]YP_009779952.1 tail sheath [Synechococcus phage ACG-2014b]AIX17329.1 tail sheath monomer protein [Synechococcus phage ACG-2014b]AIX17760.1 tail sheath monomer protein [Synechococcus phage ACG-2014b]AIX17977.1 tail sheath monomer protein [Synechococcus phage ACG-2014b]AIX18192.1 tail sheath monomer protein [Synechococcus phage ACG-2014b]AIX19350.1 tail sheath monomer protein [Synechococcus 